MHEEGLYKVFEVERMAGLLHLEGSGGRKFRVKLGPTKLASFSPGMKVRLRKSEGGGLILEAKAAEGPGPVAKPQGKAKGGQRRDRRAVPRVEFADHATVATEDRTIRCQAVDISERGISLRLPSREDLQDPLELAFKLPNGYRLLKVGGVVARVSRAGSETVWGVGFREVGQHVALALQDFVATASAEEGAASHARSKMDQTLSGLYDDAVAELANESSGGS